MRQNNFIPNPNVTTHDKGACTDAFHNTVSCCILDTERPPALMTIAGVVMIGWTGAIILGVRRFCIGGVVRDWYFAPPGVVQVGCCCCCCCFVAVVALLLLLLCCVGMVLYDDVQWVS